MDGPDDMYMETIRELRGMGGGGAQWYHARVIEFCRNDPDRPFSEIWAWAVEQATYEAGVLYPRPSRPSVMEAGAAEYEEIMAMQDLLSDP